MPPDCALERESKAVFLPFLILPFLLLAAGSFIFISGGWWWRLQNQVRERTKIHRSEKRLQRAQFDLSGSVRTSEYRTVKRPLLPRTKEPIEPAHVFEVTLEPDDFTEEKFVIVLDWLRFAD